MSENISSPIDVNAVLLEVANRFPVEEVEHPIPFYSSAQDLNTKVYNFKRMIDTFDYSSRLIKERMQEINLEIQSKKKINDMLDTFNSRQESFLDDLNNAVERVRRVNKKLSIEGDLTEKDILNSIQEKEILSSNVSKLETKSDTERTLDLLADLGESDAMADIVAKKSGGGSGE